MTNDLDERTVRVIQEAVERGFKRYGAGQPPIDAPPVLAMPEPELRKIVEDIIDRKLEGIEKRVSGAMQAGLEDLMSRIGLRVDKDHIEETADAIRGLLRLHRRADKIVGHILLTFFGSLFVGLLGLLGLNLKGGSGH